MALIINKTPYCIIVELLGYFRSLIICQEEL